MDGDKEAEGIINKITKHFICGKKSWFNPLIATEAMKKVCTKY